MDEQEAEQLVDNMSEIVEEANSNRFGWIFPFDVAYDRTGKPLIGESSDERLAN